MRGMFNRFCNLANLSPSAYVATLRQTLTPSSFIAKVIDSRMWGNG